MFDLNTAKVLFLDKEYERAAEMFYEGATEGDAEAAFDYAYCLMNGYGVERDPTLAKSFYGISETKAYRAMNLDVNMIAPEDVLTKADISAIE